MLVGIADLADVVEERAELEPLQLGGLEAQRLADAQRHVGDPARVRGGVLVVGLERVRQRLDGRDEGLLEALVAAGALQRDGRLVRDAAEQAQDLLDRVLAVGGRLADGDEALERTVVAQRREREVGPDEALRRLAHLRGLVGGDEEGLGAVADRARSESAGSTMSSIGRSSGSVS